MKDANCIKHDLYSQGLPVYESDIQRIQSILLTVNEAEKALKAFPSLQMEVPITIVDKRVL